MRTRPPPVIDMRLDGSFPPARDASLPTKIAAGALLVAIAAGGIVLVSVILWLMLWVISLLVPIALIAGLVAWGAYKYQSWKMGGSFRGPRNLYRP